ncbi:hypothetical protein NBRC116592_32370 [Colwellia sp. KU-HH00111]|uniref:winged helix-turn-helix domain-containing protein n=1 Tax=Colwellia sp. KU-HH00111 TaxID=3127652 RepID=UPI0031050291
MTKVSQVADFTQPFRLAEYLVVPEHHYIERLHTRVESKNARIEIEPLAMAMLVYLAKHQGNVVKRETLFEALWPGKIVSQGALTRIISVLRLALNESKGAPKYIKTIPKQGYCLIADVSPFTLDLKKARVWSKKNVIIMMTVLVSFFTIYLSTDKQESAIANTWFGPIIGVTSLVGVERLPTMSSDMRSILFSYRPQQAQTDSLVIQNLSDSTMVTLQNSHSQYLALTWSKDQKFIAYAAYSNGECLVEVAAYSPESKSMHARQKVTSCSAFFQIDIKFSLDSQFLYILSSQETGGYLIESFDLSSKSKSVLLDRSDSQQYADHLSITDQLSTLAFVESDLVKNISHINLLTINENQQTALETLATLATLPKALSWINSHNAFIVWQDQNYQLLALTGQWFSINNARGLHLNNLTSPAQEKILFTHEINSHFIEEHSNPLLMHNNQTSTVADSSLMEGAAAYANHTSQFALLSDRRRKGVELWLANEKLTLFQPNSLDIQYGPIKWSPDDKYLMVLSKQQRLAAIDLKTKKHTWLTNEEDTVLAGSWGVNADKIYFSKLVDDEFQLFSTGLMYPKEKQLTFNGGYFSQITSDGKSIYYNKRNQAGLWKIDIQTNKQQLVTEEFGTQNFSRWQLFDNGIYYRHNTKLGEGIIFFDFVNQTHTMLYKDLNIWMFDVSPDQTRLMLSKEERQSDIMSVTVERGK